MTDTDFRGGWLLTVTCPCGLNQTCHAVVPGLLFDELARAGWWLAEDRVRGYETRIEGLCADCQATAPARSPGAA